MKRRIEKAVVLGAGTMAMVLLLGFLGSTIAAAPALAAHTRAQHKADRTPPRLHITTPKSGARVDGPIRIAGTTSDASSVRRVRVRVEGLGHSKRAHGTGHWRYQLDPTQLSVGAHTVKVRATDSNGNRTTSTVDITVSDPPPPPPPPSHPIALGIWSDGRGGHTTDALETQIGRMFNGVRYNYKFMATIPSSRGDREYDAGRTVFYNNAESQMVGSARIQWADIAAGKYDDQLAKTVAAFQADPRWTQATPYLFSFHHEQDVASGLGKYGSPGDYRAAFRHIFDYFQSAGILWRDGGPVEMVWDVTRNSINSGTAKEYDPDLSGDGSVVGDLRRGEPRASVFSALSEPTASRPGPVPIGSASKTIRFWCSLGRVLTFCSNCLDH
jgi:hypothetical protein